MANEGLRTLVIGQKMLPLDFYSEWSKKYEVAKADLNDRERMIANCIEDLETEMELLAITGVEDKL